MTRSAQAVKDKLKVIAREKNIEFNSIMRFYMYDRFIDRLSRSKYKDNFIIKGGFYLSTLFGIDNRSTMDIDTAIKNADFTYDNIIQMLEEIIQIDASDNILFKIEKTSLIREDDEYGGWRITLRFRLDEVNDRFHIDVATGDPIHPKPNHYGYNSLIGNETYKVWTYSMETILAEKIEAIFSKLETSSRMKDYYDIYLIYHKEFKKIDIDNFRKAVEKTFKKRSFNGDLVKGLDILKNSEMLHMKWVAYSQKNKVVKKVSFDDTLKCLEKFVDILVSTTI